MNVRYGRRCGKDMGWDTRWHWRWHWRWHGTVWCSLMYGLVSGVWCLVSASIVSNLPSAIIWTGCQVGTSWPSWFHVRCPLTTWYLLPLEASKTVSNGGCATNMLMQSSQNNHCLETFHQKFIRWNHTEPHAQVCTHTCQYDAHMFTRDMTGQKGKKGTLLSLTVQPEV